MRKAKRFRSHKSGRITISFRHGNLGKQYTFELPRRLYALAVFLLCLMFLFLCINTGNYYRYKYDRKHIADLKQENLLHKKQIKAMKDELKRLEEKQQKLIEEQSALRKAMGYSPQKSIGIAIPSRGGGKGGPEPEDQILPTDFLLKSEQLAEQVDLAVAEGQRLYKIYESDPERFDRIPSRWPVAEPEISSYFGDRENPFNNEGSEFHHGIDLAGEVGFDVYAAGDGRVIYADWYPGYGRLVKIDHGNGLVSWYGHNYRLLVQEGDKVKKGQRIALMGSSGRSTGPHVHFAIQKDGEFVDPLKYLP